MGKYTSIDCGGQAYFNNHANPSNTSDFNIDCDNSSKNDQTGANPFALAKDNDGQERQHDNRLSQKSLSVPNPNSREFIQL